MGLAISKNTSSDQKALYESMWNTHWLWWCWVRVFLLQCRKLEWATALCSGGATTLDWSCECFGKPWKECWCGEMDRKNSKFSYAFDKICPVGFGQRWWACRVIQAAFCIWPLGSAEREQCLKSKFGELGGKCQWRALALLTAFPGIHSKIAHCACANLVHLCSLLLQEAQGSKVESGKSTKLGLPSLLRFARVWHFFAASFQLSAVWLNPRRESTAQPSRLLIILFPELPSTRFSISVAYYRGADLPHTLSCHLQSSPFPTMGSCLDH